VAAVTPPKAGETVQVMRDGAVFLELVVASSEPGSHAGWFTIYGGVKRESRWGEYFEARAVYAELMEDGTVRMLSTGERLRSKR
jgi:hypothetical protein